MVATRRSLCAALVLSAVLAATACSGGGAGEETTEASAASGERAVVSIRTVRVGDPGNRPAAVVPFHPGVYQRCSEAPSRKAGCRLVGAVGYAFELGELEVTVAQYVAFLNTVDPDGTNRHDLYVENMSPSRWPKYGSIRRSTGDGAPAGTHYAVAYPEWADKPIGFANFVRAASFANALTNGDVLSRDESSADGFEIVTYRIRLSRVSDHGMYDLRADAPTPATRTRSTGFAVPSQDEWVKGAYYDATGGARVYWQYPTGPLRPLHASSLDENGDVVNAGTQPLSTYSPRGAPSGTVPTWCPTQAGQSCESTNPFQLAADAYRSQYRANVSTVGQTRSRSPWGTLDQGGNVVEWTDTVAPSPLGAKDPRVWRRAHGGVANAPAYQLWISATGRLPGTDTLAERVNPWEGFRIAVIGRLAPSTP